MPGRPMSVLRATTLVAIGLAGVAAASAITTGDDSGFGDVQAMCLVQNPLSSTIEPWPDPGFEPEPARDFRFTQGPGLATETHLSLDGTERTTINWATVQGEHRVEPTNALSQQMERNLMVQVAWPCHRSLL